MKGSDRKLKMKPLGSTATSCRPVRVRGKNRPRAPPGLQRVQIRAVVPAAASCWEKSLFTGKSGAGDLTNGGNIIGGAMRGVKGKITMQQLSMSHATAQKLQLRQDGSFLLGLKAGVNFDGNMM